MLMTSTVCGEGLDGAVVTPHWWNQQISDDKLVEENLQQIAPHLRI
jgi:hypothetical protein